MIVQTHQTVPRYLPVLVILYHPDRLDNLDFNSLPCTRAHAHTESHIRIHMHTYTHSQYTHSEYTHRHVHANVCAALRHTNTQITVK